MNPGLSENDKHMSGVENAIQKPEIMLTEASPLLCQVAALHSAFSEVIMLNPKTS